MFGSKKPAGASWEDGALWSADEVRIELTAMGPPPPAQIATAVAAAQGGGGLSDDLRPRPSTHAIGRTLVLDAQGVRHLEPRRTLYSKVFSMGAPMSFAVRWNELAHVALQEQYGARSPLVMLRLVLWPLVPDAFAAAHPDLARLRNLPGLGPGAWALSLGVNDHVDQRVGRAAFDGLTRFAGGLFSGQVERVGGPPAPPSPPPPQFRSAD